MTSKKNQNPTFDPILKKHPLLEEKNYVSDDLQQLESEAAVLNQTLNSFSDKIRMIESILRKYNVNMPFRLQVDRKSSAKKKPKQEHLDDVPEYHRAHYYWLQEDWVFSWNICADRPKEFRLFLISEESEIVKREGPEGCYDVGYFLGQNFMKPFIECKIELRLEYFRYLDEFIFCIRQCLKDLREQVEEVNSSVIPE